MILWPFAASQARRVGVALLAALAYRQALCYDCSAMKTKPENVDSYLSSIPAGQRASLSALRDQINRFRPEATEHIAYSEPLFKLNGHPLVAFRASKNHCGFFVWSGTALGTLGSLLDGFDTAMATIRFAPGTTLPDHVVKAVIDARAKEIEDRWGTLPPRRPADSAP